MSDVTLTDLLVPAAIALVTTLLTTAAGWWWSARQKRRAEEATLLADAYAAVLAYREFAFSVRRRDANKPEEERVRLSEQMKQVQERLDHHLGWMQASLRTRTVAGEYTALVGETRKTVGKAIRDAWNEPAVATDADMNMPHIASDLVPLQPATEAFLVAVRRHRFPITSRLQNGWLLVQAKASSSERG